MTEWDERGTEEALVRRGRIRSFLLGSVFGGLVSLLLMPRRGRRIEAGPPRLIEKENSFSSAPCYVPDDKFT